MRRIAVTATVAMMLVAGAPAANAREGALRTCVPLWTHYSSGVVELFFGKDLSYWELRQLMGNACAR